MSTPRPKPRLADYRNPIADVMAAVDDLADKKGLPGQLVPPQPEAPAAAPATLIPISKRAKTKSAVVDENAPSPTRRLSTDIPDYLLEALLMHHAKTRQTVKYVVIAALHKYGFTVEARDLIEDGRRAK